MKAGWQAGAVGAAAAVIGVIGCVNGPEPVRESAGGNGGAGATTSSSGGAPTTSSTTSASSGAGVTSSSSSSSTTASSSSTTASSSSTTASSSSTTASSSSTTASSSSTTASSSSTTASSSSTTASSSSTTASSSSTTASSSSTTASSSSSGTTACSPQPTVAFGALSCPGGLCSVGSPAVSGYDFGYKDIGPMTTFCLATNAACMKGTLTAVNPPSYSYYGAGLGINLGPIVGGTTMPAPVQLGGTGISIALSSFPASGLRVQVTVGGVAYCASLATASATIPWAGFNTKCYDSPPDGVALTGAPAATDIEVQVPAGSTEESYDFCITSLIVTT